MSEAILAKLWAAFPRADEVTASASDYGFSHGVAVRIGCSRHAIKVQGDDVDGAIATLRRWVPKEFQRRDDVEGAADLRA